MTITTPEQMREAAAQAAARENTHDQTVWNTCAEFIAEKIRAIPIAPQPSENRLFDPDSHWGDFIRSAAAEAEKAMRKYPQPNYVITKVAEEAGEVVKAAIHAAEGRETLDNVRGEMCQLVAMLFRLWLEGDQVHGLPPVSGVMAASALTTHPADPLSDPRVKALVEAATKMRHSVCGPTGFAEAVRHNSGRAYPWPSLDDAERALDTALRAIGGEA